MKKELLMLLSVTMVFANASAQDTLTLSLPDAVGAAITHNRMVTFSLLDQQNAAARFNQTNAVFLPQLNLSYTAMASNNPLNAFGFKLQQQSVSPSDFNPQLLNHPDASQNYVGRIELNQPLINADALYQRRAAEKQVEVYGYQTTRTKEYLEFEVQRAYAQLQLTHQSVLVLTEGLATVSAIYASTKNYFEQGFLQKSDLLAVQVRVASVGNKLAEAQANVRNASDYLSLLMGRATGPIYAVDPLEQNEDPEISESQVPAERADFKALRSAIAAQQTMVQSGRTAQLPKLNAFASYMFNDKSPLGFGSSSYLVGAQVSWNLFNGTASYYRTAEQKIAQSRMEEELQDQMEQGQLELNRALRERSVIHFALRQHEASVVQAEEALRILQNRFRQGLVAINDLLQAQATLSEQRLFLNAMLAKYNTNIAMLKYLTTSDN